MKEKEIMGIRPPVWDVLKGRFARMAIGLHGHSLRIITLPEHSDDIGMTDSKKNVYLNPNHQLAKELAEPEAVMFIMGVFGHEDMHQQMTDFSLYEKAGKKKPEHEQKVFHMICNIIEDPAIEYFASRFFGGKLLEALHFSVMHIYRQSTPIDEEETASEQFFAAMIQYGDGGILKGEFTFPEARKVFREILPYFDKAIESFDSATRLENMEKVFEISRPLWIDETEALKKLMELLKKLGKDHSTSSGCGNPDFKPGEGDPKETKTEKRRKITFRKVSKEEAEELKKNGEASTEIPADGDIEVLLVEGGDDGNKDGDEPKEKNSVGIDTETPDKDAASEKNPTPTTSGGGEKSEDELDENGSAGIGAGVSDKDTYSEKDSVAAPSGSGEKSKGEPDENSSAGIGAGASDKDADSEKDSTPSPSGSDKKSEGEPDEDSDDGTDAGVSNEDPPPNENSASSPSDSSIITENESDDTDNTGGITEEEYKLTDERLQEIIAEVEGMLLESKTIMIEQAEADGEIIDVPALDKKYKGVKCKNHKVTLTRPEALSEVYANVVRSLSGNISILTNQLKRIFRADTEERERRTSGKLNIKRLSTGTPSARVFDRKRLPGNKLDTVILLLIDISGSMDGLKVQMAKLAAILLVEVFAKFGITVKVVGFTDYGGCPQHYHYTSWKNTRAERPKLLEIRARSDNYDGYSIRYAGELLKQRPESHKLLMVVSDGYPASNAYRRYDEGVADTRNAVREGSRVAKVFGVLIGSMDAGQHHIMYGNNLLHISNLDELPQRLAKKISATIKDWQ
jgi:hypothetical protein